MVKRKKKKYIKLIVSCCMIFSASFFIYYVVTQEGNKTSMPSFNIGLTNSNNDLNKLLSTAIIGTELIVPLESVQIISENQILVSFVSSSEKSALISKISLAELKKYKLYYKGTKGVSLGIIKLKNGSYEYNIYLPKGYLSK